MKRRRFYPFPQMGGNQPRADETHGKCKVIYQYWGKARHDERAGAPCHLLVYHSLDVAAVAHCLLKNKPRLLLKLAQLMGLPVEQARSWCVFLIGLHDLGKFAESFQQLREDLRKTFWPDEKIRKKNYSTRHDTLGWWLWKQYLSKQLFGANDDAWQDFIEEGMDYWFAAVTGHHGWPPDSQSQQEKIKRHFRDFDREAALVFVREWQVMNPLDLEVLGSHFDDSDFAHRQRRASWLLAGIAVLADWLGSNSDYFPFQDQPMSLKTYWEKHALPAAQKAVREAGILPPSLKPMRQPQDLFDYLEQLTPLQQACLDCVVPSEPQLFILEDVTGAGKTEAAMILAARLMSSGQAEGIYIGLPTMATANAMYERMAKVYRQLYDDGEPSPSLILSHSARHLSKAFQQSLLNLQTKDSRYGNEESIVAQCNRWLADNRKKALLADVGIGTIDQALLAVMPARHQSLRLLGLLNKVLILDEVHAYDAYTSEPLKRLIEFHAALGGSVVLLSATLTRKQREQLVAAFQGGKTAKMQKSDYPLLTHATCNQVIDEQPLQTRPSVERELGVRLLHDEQDVFKNIQAAVEAGECVCWIRNTVADAREAWKKLANNDWLDQKNLHLFHSRFTLGDRLHIEEAMLQRFGKDSNAEQRRGQVLIATQVVEQSLDLDFDRMITDLAPIDLLIQRAGRLHRHRRDKDGNPLEGDKPDERGMPMLEILSPDVDDDPQPDWYKALFPKAHYVYPDTLVLWRTARLLQEKGGWHMPNDARELLETVYDEEGEIPTGLLDTRVAVEGETLSARDAGQFATLKLKQGYRGSPLWDEDAHIATRLGDDSQTLYLARWENGKLQPWVNEDRYPWDLSSLRIRVGQLKALAPITEPALQQALEELIAREKLFDETSLIIPLRRKEQVWLAEGCNEKDQAVTIRYQPHSGLELEYD